MRMVGQPQVRGGDRFECAIRTRSEVSTGRRNVKLLWGRPEAWRSRRDRRTPETERNEGQGPTGRVTRTLSWMAWLGDRVGRHGVSVCAGAESPIHELGRRPADHRQPRYPRLVAAGHREDVLQLLCLALSAAHVPVLGGRVPPLRTRSARLSYGQRPAAPGEHPVGLRAGPVPVRRTWESPWSRRRCLRSIPCRSRWRRGLPRGASCSPPCSTWGR